MATTRHVADRLGRAVRMLRTDGPTGTWTRLLRRLYLDSGAVALDFGLLYDDVTDSTRVAWTTPSRRPAPGEPLTIRWITTPPIAGSGGHTTLFRMAQALVERGHRCTIELYDRYGGDVGQQTAVIREAWPWLEAEVGSVADGLRPADVLIATSWESAHVLGSRGSVEGHRMYFVQDFEPYFYGQGSQWSLAEDTYRFGFDTITVGRMLAALLQEEYGIDATVAEFGCDTATYRLTNTGERNGVVFYARPEVARRGYEIGMLALRDFHRRHPEQEIHLFGATPKGLDFPVTQHGRVRPSELADLYNRCLTGLALSFTNVSLVPVEMIACGAVPVVNESAHARPGLPNPHVVWSPPTPMALSDALSRVVEADAASERAAALASSVEGASWDAARQAVVAAVERRGYGDS